MWVKTDGGKENAGFAESNDCAVRAHALFTGMSYSESHQLFKQMGRIDGKATQYAIIRSIFQGDKKYELHIPHGLTLNKLRARYPKGRIYALMRGHAFAVIDGQLHDLYQVGGKCHIRLYWVDADAQQCDDQQLTKQPVPAKREINVVNDKKAQARAIFDRLNNRSMSNYAIAKQIAAELGITVANANYYVTRVFN